MNYIKSQIFDEKLHFDHFDLAFFYEPAATWGTALVVCATHLATVIHDWCSPIPRSDRDPGR